MYQCCTCTFNGIAVKSKGVHLSLYLYLTLYYILLYNYISMSTHSVCAWGNRGLCYIQCVSAKRNLFFNSQLFPLSTFANFNKNWRQMKPLNTHVSIKDPCIFSAGLYFLRGKCTLKEFHCVCPARPLLLQPPVASRPHSAKNVTPTYTAGQHKASKVCRVKVIQQKDGKEKLDTLFKLQGNKKSL